MSPSQLIHVERFTLKTFLLVGKMLQLIKITQKLHTVLT